MQYSFVLIGALAGLSAAYTPPNTANPPSGNAITSPLNEVVPAGKPFTIKWTPSAGDKVSLLLLKGPSTNAVYLSTIADTIPNSGSYTWTPSADLQSTGTDPHGYGIELVVEGTGQYQYSTQIGISSDGSSASSNSNSVSSAASSFASVETAPPSGQTQGTAQGGALAETDCDTTVAASTIPVGTISVGTISQAPAAAPTGSGNVSSIVLSPTLPITKPSTLASVAQPTVPAATAGSSNAGSTTSNGTGISTGAAPAVGVQVSGLAAVVVGLLGFLAL